MGRLVRGRTGQNGIIAKHHALDAKDRFFYFSASIVAWPFTERPFQPPFVMSEFTFQDNFGICRNGQVRVFTPYDRQWLLPQTTDPVQFRQTWWNLITGGEKKQRIEAHN